jgi:hypothetical protein
MIMARTRRVLAGSIVSLICWAGAASAQQTPPPPLPSGPLVLEPMHNGFLLAPEVKVTRIDHKVGTMAGGYGGWVKDDHLLLGGGVYVQANRKRGSESLAYGGAVIGWFFNPEQTISVSAKTLAGVGRISETSSVEIPYCMLPERYLCLPPPGDYHGFDRDIRFHTTFFVAEPEIDVVARVGKRIRLMAGLGYRLTADRYHQSGSRAARGPSGTFSVQFNFGK